MSNEQQTGGLQSKQKLQVHPFENKESTEFASDMTIESSSHEGKKRIQEPVSERTLWH